MAAMIAFDIWNLFKARSNFSSRYPSHQGDGGGQLTKLSFGDAVGAHKRLPMNNYSGGFQSHLMRSE